MQNVFSNEHCHKFGLNPQEKGAKTTLQYISVLWGNNT